MGKIGVRDGGFRLIPQSLHSMLGLCQRAGKVSSGEVAAELALKKRKADLLLLAEDASERTAERFIGMAGRLGVPCYRVGTREELGAALGKEFRATVVIQSRDFKNGIVKIMSQAGLAPVSVRG